MDKLFNQREKRLLILLKAEQKWDQYFELFERIFISPEATHIKFMDINGWETPANIFVDVINDQTVTASGVYIQETAPEHGPCIGNNYEQQMPVPGVIRPTAEIVGASAINEGATVTLSANATVDTDKGGAPFYYWCAEKGLIEFDPAYPDYS